MTSTVADMDILKDIPGYKAIMKAVLKTQIQLLVEQLSDHTGEESIVLTASVNDGSLSHLGSLTGKGFLEGRDEIKSQFLAYCLKSHHKRKTQEEPAPPYQRSNISHPGPRTAIQQTSKRPRLHPMAVNRSGSQGSDPEGSLPGDGSRDAMFTSTPAKGTQQSQRGISSDSLVGQSKTLPSESPSMLKHEQSGAVLGGDGDSSDIRTDLMAPASLPPTIGLSHTQTSSSGAGDNNQQSDKEQTDTGVASQEGGASIKIEPNTESELDLEITGIEGGDNSSQMSGENWDQNVSGFGGTMGDGSFDQSGSQAGYIHHTGRPKSGQEKRPLSNDASLDKSVVQASGMRNLMNYDAQKGNASMEKVMDWRAVGSLARPGTLEQHIQGSKTKPETEGQHMHVFGPLSRPRTVEQHIQDAFSIKPPAESSKTITEMNESQRLALVQPKSGVPLIGTPRIDIQIKSNTNFKKPVGGPQNIIQERPLSETLTPKGGSIKKFNTKQIFSTVIQMKRPAGRPRKQLAGNESFTSAVQMQPVNPVVDLQQKQLTSSPQERPNIKVTYVKASAVAMDLLVPGREKKENSSSATKSSTDPPTTSGPNVGPHFVGPAANPNFFFKRRGRRPQKHVFRTPPTESPVKRKVGRPRKVIPDVCPVEIERVGSPSDMQPKETIGKHDESSTHDTSPTRKNYVEPIEDIIDTDEGSPVKMNTKVNLAGTDRMIEETSDSSKKPVEMHHAKRHVGRPKKIQLPKRRPGRPRKNQLGSLIQRPYFSKPLHGVYKRPVGRPRKRPVGRPRKIKENSGLAAALVHTSNVRGKQEKSKMLVVELDDIMKTKQRSLMTNSEVCNLPDSFGNDTHRMVTVDVDRQEVDKDSSIEPSQIKVSPKPKVHLPKSMRQEILEVAKQEGIDAAASFYGIAKSTVYNWRAQVKRSEGPELNYSKAQVKQSNGFELNSTSAQMKKSDKHELHSSSASSSAEELVSSSNVGENKVIQMLPQSEMRIIKWIKEQRTNNVNVTAEMIKVYADAVTFGKVPGFEASDEWLRSFIDKNDLSNVLGI